MSIYKYKENLYQVVQVFHNTYPILEAIQTFSTQLFDARSGREIAIRALTGSPDATMLVAYNVTASLHGTRNIVGATSFRILENKIQRICTGVIHPRQGIGSALVQATMDMWPGLPMWTKSLDAAHPFCESLGMEPTGKVDGEMTYYEGVCKTKMIAIDE